MLLKLDCVGTTIYYHALGLGVNLIYSSLSNYFRVTQERHHISELVYYSTSVLSVTLVSILVLDICRGCAP